MKRLIAILLVFVLLLCSCASKKPDAIAEAQAILQLKLDNDELYTAEEVSAALLADPADARQQEILADILLPASLGITLPNIDVSRVLRSSTVPLSAFDEGGADMVMDLTERGYAKVDPDKMIYQEYVALENSWFLSEEEIESLKTAYPQLAEIDLTKWTKGQKDAYDSAMLTENRWEGLTMEQKVALNERNILSEDLQYLLKEFQNVDVILQQKDEDLKELLEDYYEINLEFYLGTDTCEALTAKN